VEGEEEDEELWLLKRPINICQSGTSPFFEGEAELQNPPNIAPVCQQTFTGRRTAAWNEPTTGDIFEKFLQRDFHMSYTIECY